MNGRISIKQFSHLRWHTQWVQHEQAKVLHALDENTDLTLYWIFTSAHSTSLIPHQQSHWNDPVSNLLVKLCFIVYQ